MSGNSSALDRLKANSETLLSGANDALNDQLAKFQSDLSERLRHELNTISSDINEKVNLLSNDLEVKGSTICEKTTEISDKIEQWILWKGLGLSVIGILMCLVIFGSSWSLWRYMTNEVNALTSEIIEKEERIAYLRKLERNAVAALKEKYQKKHWKVLFYESRGQKYVVMPRGFTEMGWCIEEGTPCVKLKN